MNTFLQSVEVSANIIYTFAKYFIDTPIQEANGLDDHEFSELLCSELNEFINKDHHNVLPSEFVDKVTALCEILDEYQDGVYVEQFPRTEFVRFSRDIVRMLEQYYSALNIQLEEHDEYELSMRLIEESDQYDEMVDELLQNDLRAYLQDNEYKPPMVIHDNTEIECTICYLTKPDHVTFQCAHDCCRDCYRNMLDSEATVKCHMCRGSI